MSETPLDPVDEPVARTANEEDHSDITTLTGEPAENEAGGDDELA